ncbi:LAXTG-anchored chaplin ChpA [Streptomyces chiangmaiensis]
MVAAAAATGILSLCGNPVFADSNADGTAAGSPGVASGNTVQVPVHVPVNICGNTVDVIAALNPAFGNACANGPGRQAPSEQQTSTVPAQTPHDTTGTNNPGGSTTPGNNGSSVSYPPGTGQGDNQPGGSTTPGNNGSSVSYPPGTGQGDNQPGESQETQPGQSDTPQIGTPVINSPSTSSSHTAPALAETGSTGLLAVSAVSVAMLAGGLILYRRGRATSHR